MRSPTPPVAAVPAGSAAAAAQQPPAPANVEDPRRRLRFRCAFVRKIYGILALQFVLTAAVAATARFVRPVQRFLAYGPPAAVVWPTVVVVVIILVSPLVVCAVMFPMLEEREKQPARNRVLLALFTLCCSFSIAVSAAPTSDFYVVLQIAILPVLGFTVITIWAAKRGYDIRHTFPSLFACLFLQHPYIVVLIPFPLKMVGIAIWGFLATLVFSGSAVAVHDLDYNDGDRLQRRRQR